MLTDQETCDLHEVKYVHKVPGGPGVPKKSPFKELIKIRLIHCLSLLQEKKKLISITFVILQAYEE